MKKIHQLKLKFLLVVTTVFATIIYFFGFGISHFFIRSSDLKKRNNKSPNTYWQKTSYLVTDLEEMS